MLDILVQDRRKAAAARRLFKQLLAGLHCRRYRLITDGLKGAGVAQREAQAALAAIGERRAAGRWTAQDGRRQPLMAV